MNFFFFRSEYYVNGCVAVFVFVVVVVVVVVVVFLFFLFLFFIYILGPKTDVVVGNKTLSSRL